MEFRRFFWQCLSGEFKSTLRTDTGGLASICDSLNYSGTTVARILYFTSYETYLFSLSNEVVIRRYRQKI